MTELGRPQTQGSTELFCKPTKNTAKQRNPKLS